jgi:hypothetical protein
MAEKIKMVDFEFSPVGELWQIDSKRKDTNVSV